MRMKVKAFKMPCGLVEKLDLTDLPPGLTIERAVSILTWQICTCHCQYGDTCGAFYDHVRARVQAREIIGILEIGTFGHVKNRTLDMNNNEKQRK